MLLHLPPRGEVSSWPISSENAISQLVLPLSPPTGHGQQCLHQQVLGTLFEILTSHYRMAKYHEESLATLQAPEAGAAASDRDRRRLHQGSCSNGGVSALQTQAPDAVSSSHVSRVIGSH